MIEEYRKCPFCYNEKDQKRTVQDRTSYELFKNKIKVSFWMVCGRCGADWNYTEIKYIKIKPFVYEKEYRSTKNRKEFFDLIKSRYPSLKDKTITRRYDEMQSRYGLHKTKNQKLVKSKSIKKFKSKPITTPESEATEEPEVIEIVEDIIIEKPKPRDPQSYPDELKSEPSRIKMMMFHDMIRLGKNYKNEKYLIRYGFRIEEIRWLEDQGWI